MYVFIWRNLTTFSRSYSFSLVKSNQEESFSFVQIIIRCTSKILMSTQLTTMFAIKITISKEINNFCKIIFSVTQILFLFHYIFNFHLSICRTIIKCLTVIACLFLLFVSLSFLLFPVFFFLISYCQKRTS